MSDPTTSGPTTSRPATRFPEKMSGSRAELDRLLDDVHVGHVAAQLGGEPAIFPVAVARWDDHLVWHGSTGSSWLRALGAGASVAVGVTAVDAYVVGRTGFENSFWYRSAVVRGRPHRVTGPGLREALDRLTEHLVPGRTGEVRAPSAKELAATTVLAVPLDDWTLRLSSEWPDDPAADVAGDAWAGVVPRATTYAEPLPAPDLRPGVPVPPSVRRLVDGTTPA